MDYEKALRLLGLSQGYTEDDLKKAYRKQAKKYHPDINGGDDNLFKLVKESYDYLMVSRNSPRQGLFNRQTSKSVHHGSDIFSYIVK